MQTINQLNLKIQILHIKMVEKDATIIALKQAINECSNITTSPMPSPMVIFVPSSDDIDHHRGKVAQTKQNF